MRSSVIQENFKSRLLIKSIKTNSQGKTKTKTSQWNPDYSNTLGKENWFELSGGS